ncbi:hypothetical protein BDY21DRAFT_175893 [Lineolata rhizophorae]|uniref:Uncharacterized protein n=1 Tax=Lineolata rhizophorae TaxID=578093 RepID=A0A6A6NKP1_9PEZI|nr:hypothetical protein BDY21DRAFT_175893 [Lineolata rhizophorae]
MAWKAAVPVTGQIPETSFINPMISKFASLDRILDIINGMFGDGSERVKFSEEYRDTILAILSINQEQGPYAPITPQTINLAKSELRRRRVVEAESTAATCVEHTQHEAPSWPPQKPVPLPFLTWNPTVTVTVAVLFTVILAAVPGYKAWQHPPPKPGSTRDADFWFLVQGCTMQLIGLFTIILPIALGPRMLLRQWFWTWLLVGVNFIYSVAPIPVYLHFPTEWAATIAFLGSAAQAFVTLQALFLIEKQKIQ